ncbi:MAG: IS66 family insertion sequence element accessory protein TnpB [Candidatus Lokiarchaeota archaeon]|nr:IS66 family insertion sequence element accessory protein TnpB [Candidatus Lokiarchaeota archaeon]
MFPVFPGLRFYLYSQPTDMRKSFDGLSGIVTNARLGNPTSGDVYVFVNRRRDRMKLLVWERTGFWLFYKRLEKGTFQIPPHSADQKTIELSYDVLMMLVEGIDITHIKRRPRYQK